MEVFLDFGLFELVAALGLSFLARRIYSRLLPGSIFLLASILLPVVAIVLARGEFERWICLAILITALVNGAVIAANIQKGQVPALHVAFKRSLKTRGREGAAGTDK